MIKLLFEEENKVTMRCLSKGTLKKHFNWCVSLMVKDLIEPDDPNSVYNVSDFITLDMYDRIMRDIDCDNYWHLEIKIIDMFVKQGIINSYACSIIHSLIHSEDPHANEEAIFACRMAEFELSNNISILESTSLDEYKKAWHYLKYNKSIMPYHVIEFETTNIIMINGICIHQSRPDCNEVLINNLITPNEICLEMKYFHPETLDMSKFFRNDLDMLQENYKSKQYPLESYLAKLNCFPGISNKLDRIFNSLNKDRRTNELIISERYGSWGGTMAKINLICDNDDVPFISQQQIKTLDMGSNREIFSGSHVSMKYKDNIASRRVNVRFGYIKTSTM